MRLDAIEVECYAGAKADETPRRFRWKGRLVEVDEVLHRWHQVERGREAPRADCFRVRGADRHQYLLKHDLESDDWFLGLDWPAASDASPRGAHVSRRCARRIRDVRP